MWLKTLLKGVADRRQPTPSLPRRSENSKFCKRATFELLEERRVLTTTLYLDFGFGIGSGNVLSTTVAAVRDIAGVGIHGDGTGPNLNSGFNPMPLTSSLDFRPLGYDFNGDAAINNADITALANADFGGGRRRRYGWRAILSERSRSLQFRVAKRAFFDLNPGGPIQIRPLFQRIAIVG